MIITPADGPVFSIAEASSNHGQDFDRAIQIIDAAKSAGFNAVKFQLFEIEKLFAPEILFVSEEHRSRSAWELPFEFVPDLSAYSRSKGLLFSCTPFSLEAVESLAPYVDFFKIASYELLWQDLIRATCATELPLVVSTGMATLKEVAAAVEVARLAGCVDLTLLHCVSAYPTRLTDANLSAISTLRRTFNLQVGWSDHSNDPAVIYRAVNRWGASMIEMHLDTDGSGAEFGPGHCWLPLSAAEVLGNLRRGASADGSGVKEPAASELEERFWRADPGDGLRPLKHIRKPWSEERQH